jgi:hypothetical protein
VRGIVTNPPYERAEEFCTHALKLTAPVKGVVAMLLRCDFDHAKRRAYLFADCPQFAKKIGLTRRIVWFVVADGKPKASPSFNHAWFLWDWQHAGPPAIAYGPNVRPRDAIFEKRKGFQTCHAAKSAARIRPEEGRHQQDHLGR